MPRVGWAAISKLMGRLNSRATTIFCWLPPERLAPYVSALGVRTSKRSISFLAFSRMAGRLMEIVLRETDRLNRLITDFLQYARPSPPRLEAVELAPVVAETLEMLSRGEGKGIRMESSIAPGLAVLADAEQLRQLLWNLLLNAAQAMPSGGRLLLGASLCSRPAAQAERELIRTMQQGEGSRGVEICISDTGVGIAPDVLDHIFDPFFTTKRAGSGLGLATVHRIVESNGGRLWVESSPGVGTTFRIWLPQAKAGQ